MEGKPPPPSPPDRSTQDDAYATGPGSKKADVLQLFAEEAKVSRQTVETGRVRVARVTHTRDHLVDELLARTDVEIERVPIGRVVDAIPPIKEDADLTIVPVVEETVVVERRLVLKEELHIRRIHTTERYQETVKLRHQTAQVTRIPARKPAADGDVAAGAIPQRKPEDT
jgi:uncharacterized protein (TIGR02271 family)